MWVWERRVRRIAKLGARYEALVRRDERSKARHERDLNEARLRWCRRRDLTMAAILQGAPF